MTSRLLVDKIESKTGDQIDLSTNQLKMPVGHVIQVVTNVNTETSNINSDTTSFVASGFSVSITPKAVGNKILVQYNTAMAHKQVTGASECKLYIDGSQASTSNGGTSTGSYWGGYCVATNNATDYSPRLGTYLYTAVDTNSHTFEPYFRSMNTNNFYFIHSDASAMIMATEIQA